MSVFQRRNMLDVFEKVCDDVRAKDPRRLEKFVHRLDEDLVTVLDGVLEIGEGRRHPNGNYHSVKRVFPGK